MSTGRDSIQEMKKRVALWTGIAAAFLVLACVTAGVYASYYASHALPQTTVAGQAVGGMTRDQVAQTLTQRTQDAMVTVRVAEHEIPTRLSDLGVTVDIDATVERIFDANRSIWNRFGAFFHGRSLPLEATGDEQTLIRYRESLIERVGSVVRDASLRPREDGSGFDVIEASAGLTLKIDDLRALRDRMIHDLSLAESSLESTIQQPRVTTERAREAAEQAMSVITPAVSITDGIRTYTASMIDKMRWVTVSEDLNAPQAASIRPDAVREWVRRLGESTNEEPRAGVHNVNSRGDVVSTADAGSPGWHVSNTDAVAAELLSALEQKKPYSGDFDYEKTDPSFETRLIPDGAGDSVYRAAPGEKWIDLDLSTNTVSAYEGSTIVQGPIPIVPGEPDTPTVVGNFRIYLQYRSQTMRGLNKDGTPYETEDVPWVSYFHGSYAFHGAPWRSSFGWSGAGGSHGCVNMPVPSAKWLYEWSENGTRVFSHY